MRARAIDLRALVISLCAAFMTVLLVQEFRSVGALTFEIPETIFDHVLADVPLSRQAIVMARNAEPLMPRGATLTVIAPALAPDYDFTHYLTASGMLPRHRVLHPTLAADEHWPDFVIALGDPLQHRGYVLVREFREGRLYAVRR
jgi:hypothetical protein